MIVNIVACRCLSGKTNRIREMLVAEGFLVQVKKAWRPGVLRISANGKLVWSWRLLRTLPYQKDLADLVRASIGV